MTALSKQCYNASNEEKAEEFVDHRKLLDEVTDQSERCCGKNDICSHEVLRDGEPNSNSTVVQNKIMRKVAFMP
jgi:hypothetical protein